MCEYMQGKGEPGHEAIYFTSVSKTCMWTTSNGLCCPGNLQAWSDEQFRPEFLDHPHFVTVCNNVSCEHQRELMLP